MGHRTFKTLTLCLLLYPIPVASYTYYRDAESCDLVGDGDIYGIGIRTSIYIQSFTAIIGLVASGPEILHTLRLGFNAIATSIVINFWKDIHNKSFLYLEYWILLASLQFILFIFNFISIMMAVEKIMKENKPQRHHRISFSTINNILGQAFKETWKEEFWLKFNHSMGSLGYFSIAWTLLLSSALLGTQIWLYWAGLELGHSPGCKAMINFYTDIDIYNERWVAFNMTFSLAAAATVLPLTVTAFTLYFACGLLFEIEKLGVDRPFDRLAELLVPMETRKWKVRFFGMLILPNVTGWAILILWQLASVGLILVVSLPTTFTFTIIYTLIGLFALVSGIFWTEATIQVNKIDLSGATITSSGQIMPLIVTIFTSIPILWTVILSFVTEWNKKQAENQQTQNTSTSGAANGAGLGHAETENQAVEPVIAGDHGLDAGTIV